MKTCLESKNRRGLLAALLMAALFFCLSFGPVARAVTMEELREMDPEEVVRDYLMPYLECDGRRILLFGAELNISNGRPSTRTYGERYMFGKLVHAEYVMKNLEALATEEDKILGEVQRLLLGPWENNGITTFKHATREDYRVLDLETGGWKRVRRTYAILVEHYTENQHKRRVALIALIPQEDPVDGTMSVGFSIARK